MEITGKTQGNFVWTNVATLCMATDTTCLLYPKLIFAEGIVKNKKKQYLHVQVSYVLFQLMVTLFFTSRINWNTICEYRATTTSCFLLHSLSFHLLECFQIFQSTFIHCYNKLLKLNVSQTWPGDIFGFFLHSFKYETGRIHFRLEYWKRLLSFNPWFYSFGHNSLWLHETAPKILEQWNPCLLSTIDIIWRFSDVCPIHIDFLWFGSDSCTWYQAMNMFSHKIYRLLEWKF